MGYISLEKLMKKNPTSLYKVALMGAMRANELAQGVKPLVESESKKVTTIALEEIAAQKVNYENTKPKSKSGS